MKKLLFILLILMLPMVASADPIEINGKHNVPDPMCTLKNGTAWNKVVHWFSDSDATHPYAPVRVYEAMNWEKTDTCNWLRSNKFTIEFELEKKEKKQLEDKNQEEEKTGKGWNIPNIPNIPKNIDISIPKFKGFKK